MNPTLPYFITSLVEDEGNPISQFNGDPDNFEAMTPIDGNGFNIRGTAATRIAPSMTEYPGNKDFRMNFKNIVRLNPSKICYSQLLNKLYIAKDIEVEIVFTWNEAQKNDGEIPSQIRALCVYEREEDRSKPVQVCSEHNPRGQADGSLIISSCDEDRYEFNNRTGRYSLVIPVNAAEDGKKEISIKFLCKNSCREGLNRRPTIMLITLENQSEEIIGRVKFGVKICSCPKRDRMKDEESHNKNLVPKNDAATERQNPEFQIPTVTKLDKEAIMKLSQIVYGRLLILKSQGLDNSEQFNTALETYKKFTKGCLNDLEQT